MMRDVDLMLVLLQLAFEAPALEMAAVPVRLAQAPNACDGHGQEGHTGGDGDQLN